MDGGDTGVGQNFISQTEASEQQQQQRIPGSVDPSPPGGGGGKLMVPHGHGNDNLTRSISTPLIHSTSKDEDKENSKWTVTLILLVAYFANTK